MRVLYVTHIMYYYALIKYSHIFDVLRLFYQRSTVFSEKRHSKENMSTEALIAISARVLSRKSTCITYSTYGMFCSGNFL